MRVLRFETNDKKLIAEGLRHASRWIDGSEHEDFCNTENGPGNICDCGKVLACEQIAAALRFLGYGPRRKA